MKGSDPSVKALIGNPTTDIQMVPGGDGCYRHHQYGSVYWNREAGVHFIMGSIREKWSALGWERSFLKYPVTDELANPDRVGRYNHFQGGSIYWHPSTGAFEVHGDIRALWSQIGWELSGLGYPKSDELTASDRVGRFNHFQAGSIYWKPNLGPHFVLGSISNYFHTNGGFANANFGYPISNELAPATGNPNRFGDFENGVIYWKQSTGRTSELGKFPLASRDRDQLEAEARTQVASLIAPYGNQAYIDRQPEIKGVTHYTRQGFNNVINREIQLELRIKYKAEFIGIDGALPDPYTDLTLWMAFRKEKTSSGTNIILTLTRAAMKTTVPAPTNAFVSPETINNKLKNDVLKNIIGKPRVMGTVPSNINVLSVKVMSNGDLNTYIEPL